METVETTAGDTTFADPADRISVRAQLETLQQKLDERNMEIVVSHFVLGMNQQEVAEMLGISRRAVVKRLTRLKNQLTELPSISSDKSLNGGTAHD